MRQSSVPISVPERDMLAIGIDIDGGDRALAERRAKRGECETCGIQTHKISVFGKKTPLTKEGKVIKGRCLKCHQVQGSDHRPSTQPQLSSQPRIARNTGLGAQSPRTPPSMRQQSSRFPTQQQQGLQRRQFSTPVILNEHDLPPAPVTQQQHSTRNDVPSRQQSPRRKTQQHSQPEQSFAVPSHLEFDDGASVVSGITLDATLYRAARDGTSSAAVDYDSEEEDAKMPLTQRRPGPEPSMMSNHDRQSEQRSNEDLAPVGLENNTDNLNLKPPPAPYAVEVGASRVNSLAAKEYYGERPIMGSPRQLIDSKPLAVPARKRSMVKHISSNEEHLFTESSRAEPPRINSTLRGVPDDGMIDDPMSTMVGNVGLKSANFRGRPDDDVIHDPMGDVAALKSTGGPDMGLANAAVGAPSKDRVNNMMQRLLKVEKMNEQQSRKGKKQKDKTLQEIPVIIECINSNDGDSNIRERAFVALAEILWRSGDKARDYIIQHKGIDALVNAMWEDMAIVRIQDAALEFLFSLAASSDGRASSDLLTNQESICDSLLFAMQSHITVPSIQLKGCSILACLSSASSNNKKISDGSLSGAQLIVLNALCNHIDSAEIQRIGIQTLYFQCSLSENAESNKRSLIQSTLDNGRPGVDVVVDAMMQLCDDIVSTEFACKMWWCLTSSEDLVKSTSVIPGVVKQILIACQRHIENNKALALIEASFGVFGNLAHIETMRIELQQQGVVQILIDGMHFHRNDFGVNIEACSALANVALFDCGRDDAVREGGVRTIVDAMQLFIESPEFVAEAARALVCLSVHSDEAKQQMMSSEVVHCLVQASYKHNSNPQVQETTVALIASLTVDAQGTEIVLEHGGISLLTRTLESASGLRILDSATLACRNISCQSVHPETLTQPGIVTRVVDAMQLHEKEASIQRNACCLLLNIISKSVDSPGSIVGRDGVASLVKAMQEHMESGELLELACGVLWGLVNNSDDRRRLLVGSGAIDVVACSLVMHPNRTSTLEPACGVLANASLEPSLAEAATNAQAVSNTAEAMRSNSSTLSLLEIGCITLRNIVLKLPRFAQEASAAVSVVINAMRDNMEDENFLREACNLLWVLAVHSDDCQSKISALDGIPVLMSCLEQSSKDSDVHCAALGAFNLCTAEDDN